MPILVISKKIIQMNVGMYLRKVLIRLLLPLGSMILVNFLMITYIEMSLRFVLTFLVSALTFGTAVLVFGLNTSEMHILKQALTKIKSKF